MVFPETMSRAGMFMLWPPGATILILPGRYRAKTGLVPLDGEWVELDPNSRTTGRSLQNQ
jgi:hypothetical protein